MCATLRITAVGKHMCCVINPDAVFFVKTLNCFLLKVLNAATLLNWNRNVFSFFQRLGFIL